MSEQNSTIKTMPLKLKVPTKDVILFAYYFLYIQVFIEGSLVSTHLLVTHVGPCDDGRDADVPLTVKEFIISTRDYDSTLSGKFNISEDVADGWAVKATMQKCQDVRNTDTCDHFRSFWLVRAGCSDDAESAYTTLFHHTAPELECPIRAGTYKLQDYPIFTAGNSLTVHESKISTSVFGYSLLLEGTTVDRRELFCVEAYLKLLYLRQHNWLNKRNNQTMSSLTTTSQDVDEDDE